MNEFGEAAARWLIDNPILIPFYLVGLWLLIIKPIIKGSGTDESSAKRQNKDTKPDKPDRYS